MSKPYQQADVVQTAPTQIAEVYPLTPLQHGMLFHHLYDERSGVDTEQMVYAINGGLDVALFKRAWQRVVDRHPIMRTGLRWEGLDSPEQCVRRGVSLEWGEEDWRALSEAERHARLDEYLERDRQRGFALTEPTLNRMQLFRESDSRYRFVWTFHHAIIDGRTFAILLKEVFAFYDAFCEGGDLDLPLPRPFRDHVEWLDRMDLSRAESFWRTTLAGFTTPTPLVMRRAVAESAPADLKYTEQEARLSRAATGALRGFAKANGLTLNTLLQGAWALLLSRYSGADDVVFGATRACRKTGVAGAEDMTGLFINTLPMRVRVDGRAVLKDWLARIREQHLALRDFEHTPLMRIEEWGETPRGRSLFDTILVFENYEMSAYLETLGERWRQCEFELLEQTNYPLSLSGWGGSELLLKLAYHQRDFDEATISRMLGHLCTLLENMPAISDEPLARLTMLPARERDQLLVEWNDTRADYPARLCAHELFEAQAARTPDAIALASGGERMSYRELNARANRLARHLQALGVVPEARVGIALDRSCEMIVAMLATLKAGGAYVPLDPAYPRERLAAMIDDARPVALITRQRLREGLPALDAREVFVDEESQAVRHSDENLPVTVTPSNLAYVIYTSGSTGRPKGVMIEHGALVNYACGAALAHAMAAEDRVLQFASISFDASIEEILPTLVRGATLVLRTDEMIASCSAFLAQCREWQVTLCDLPTAFWHELNEHLDATGSELPASLRLVIIGGERARPDALAAWRRKVGGRVRLLNTYGPTETTVVATAGDLTPVMGEHAAGEVSIGTPVANAQGYIVDADLEPVPIGGIGELFVGGAGVARGYLNDPEKTAARFIPHPFADGPGARLYRTGDLARFRPDGQIEFCGRADGQVKISGFRIELEEIEAALAHHPRINQAVVLARGEETEPKRLVAYVVPAERPADEAAVAAAAAELRRFLTGRLPRYMVPSAFVLLDAMPLSASGKINRKALPAYEAARQETASAYVKPRDPLEYQLVQIWEELFGTSPIGIADSFFDLGGHSLLAVRMMDRIEQALGRSLPLATLFAGATIEHLARALLDHETPNRAAPVVEVQRGDGRLPFFYLHGDFNGGGLYCRRLARHLGERQPFYALQPHGLDGQAVPPSIEAMAETHLRLLRQVQPAGPYLLGGHCNGGLIAFEMARRLEASGERVALLALVCTAGANTRFRNLRRLSDALGALRRMPADGRQQQFVEWRERAIRLAGMRDYYAGRLRGLMRALIFEPARFVRKAKGSAGVLVSALRERAAESTQAAQRDMTGAVTDARQAIIHAYEQAMAAYVPGRFSGRVTLFWPEELASDLAGDNTCGWRNAADVDTQMVPGGHLTCITKHVEQLAMRLKEQIEKVRARA
ncbi:MAG TPA: amino acid adenylation domain-containing protein [Blastocatellia bacterium]|nr:amino acid adenylation domain-containing protein [Blastocatellia bacterium]